MLPHINLERNWDLQMSKRAVKAAGWIAIGASIVAVAVIGDMLFGELTNIDRLRQDARKFRNEVAYTAFSTKNIIPNLRHTYSATSNGRKDETRLFQSNEFGAVQNGNSTQSGKIRILFLGGSTTESNEVQEVNRFPSVVERLLQSAGLSVKTVNLGVRGHTTVDSINVLVNRFIELKPDVVVLMHNINDRLRSSTRQSYVPFLGKTKEISGHTISDKVSSTLSALADYATYHSNLIFQLRFSSDYRIAWLDRETAEDVAAGGIKVPVDALTRKPDAASFEQYLQIFVAVGKALKVKPVLMTQALGFENNDQVEFNKIIRKVAVGDNVDLIDLSEKIGTGPLAGWAFLSDGVHLNDDGSIAAGNIITQALARTLGDKQTVPTLHIPSIVKLHELHQICIPSDINAALQPTKPWRLGGIQGRYPSLSSDGKWLLYQRWVDGKDKLQLLGVGTGKLSQLTPIEMATNERHPSFLDVNNGHLKIVYGSGFSEKEPQNFERLMVLKWPENTREPLLPDESTSGSIPAVFGTSVYFAGREITKLSKPPKIYQFDLARKTLRRLTDGDGEHWRPAVDQFGNIYFIAHKGEHFDIYVRDKNSGQKKFWGTGSDEWDPAVSSNGELLAFASKVSGKWDLFFTQVKNGQASAIKRLTDDNRDNWDPFISSDGSLLLYASAGPTGPEIRGICLHGAR
jgi:lysophospholipase L1-like esterase